MDRISILFAKYPFFRLVIALILGIVYFEISGFSYIIFVFVLLIIATGGIIVSFFFTDSKISVFGISLLLIIFCFGYLLSYNFSKNTQILDGKDLKGIFQIELTDFPVVKDKSVQLKTKLISYTDSIHTKEKVGKAIIYIFKDSASMSLKSGDRLLVDMSLSLPQNSGNPCEFDYRKYILRKGFCGTGYVDALRWKKIGHNNKFSIIRISQNYRLNLLNIYRKLNINGSEFAILSALTLGFTHSLDPEVRENFSATGVAHILSVSGFHVAIIYGMASFFLAFLDKNRRYKRIKFILIIILLWFYAFMTGLSPSVCRASLMFSVFLVGRILNKQTHIYNTIYFSAFVLLMINPMWIFDVGFQLSYSALLSIVYFHPILSDIIDIKNRRLREVWNLLVVSVSAQIGVFPLGLYYFHQFPMLFIIANLIAIPLSSIIIYTDILLLVIYKISTISIISTIGIIHKLILMIESTLVVIIKSMYISLQFIKEIKYSVFFTWIDPLQLIVIYLALFTFAIIISKDASFKIKYRTIIIFLSSLILFFITNIYNQVYNSNYKNLIVFNDNKNIMINAVQNRENIVIITDSLDNKKNATNFWIRYNLFQPNYKFIDKNSIVSSFYFDKKRFAIISSNNIFKYSAESPLLVDYLIIAKNISPSKSIFEYYFKPKEIIIANGTSYINKKKFQEIAKEYNITCYSISDKGAFWLSNKHIDSKKRSSDK